MFNLMPILAGGLVVFISLVVLRFVNSKQLSNFSIKLLVLTFVIAGVSITASIRNFNDIIIVCLPIIVIAILEKTVSVYLAQFVNNDKVSIIKLFVILSYFTGIIVAKYLL